MSTLWSLSAGEAAAWVAAVGGAIALLKQGYNSLKKRQKEKDEIEEALRHAPEVKYQLELGNVGEAVRHLNVIIDSQARHIATQDKRLGSCDEEIQHLKERNDALEAEAEGWEAKYRELEREFNLEKRDHDRKYASIKAEMEEMRRSFVRQLQVFRGEKDTKNE